MELGLNLGYWGTGKDQDNIALALEADRLGYAVAWVAEAYGSDAPSVLSWVGALTEHIDLGAAVMQIPARTPATVAGQPTAPNSSASMPCSCAFQSSGIIWPLAW